MNDTARPRVCVIGGGIVGSAAALALARRAARVVLLERFEARHRRGGSHGSSRIFRLSYDQPDYARMAQLALPLWRRLEEETAATLLDITGGVDHGDPTAVAEVARGLEQAGSPGTMLDASEAARRWPGMRFDGDVLFQPLAGRLHADMALATFQSAAAASGAQLRFGSPATGVRESSIGVDVETPDGVHAADVVVVACGAWTSGLVGSLLPLPPLVVTEELPVHFAPRDSTLPWPSFVHHRASGVMYGLAAPGDEGVKVGEHHAGRPVDPDRRPAEPDLAACERVSEYVSEWLPGLDPTPRSWAGCLYDTTPTEDFVIDRRGPLVIAAGTSGHGFKFAPILGEMVADLVFGGSQHLARFRLPEPAAGRG